ncbi:type II toxin-antitoxin system HipA family toxin [Rhizobacter sp. Root1221]|uniref:type II toxin-antitoxin system HipA family toxin n=1 Tax=Rhizobacter sp. Root1221 TaxID=1736433 RepID=UPI0006F85726|nr:HipA domain-containing protein [Rhizobacter sp. Root1221]KQV98471.1 phosphatidylinositol kinase [Rhizobacter sp. Root1221]
MIDACTLQLHLDGAWHDAGSTSLFGPVNAGWQARSYTGYAADWAVAHAGRRDAAAFSCRTPVGLKALELPHWPVFLVDALPQGFGRGELLKRLQLPATAQSEADWPLLLAGAGNPIGNLRVKEAAEWLAARAGPTQGFTDAEVARRGEDFAEHLASHGLFVAGSSGVQGEWPKILLTRGRDGLLYLDHTLPDSEATEHFIVKFGRGADADLARILRHEAPYMQAARLLGLRVHADLVFRERALFIPRFDRRVDADAAAPQVIRLAQESIATLTGKVGFITVPSHDDVCRQLVLRCTDPQAEVLEYLRRDVANLALGNKDNHARNTAVQRDDQGVVRLTPLFDFVPMYMHPDGIARRIRWEGNDGGAPDWARVLDAVCQAARGRPPAALDRDHLAEGLRSMAPALLAVRDHGESIGIEHEVLSHLAPGIDAQVRQLENLR